MKKRALVVAMATALVLSQNTMVFAAGSSSSSTSVVTTITKGEVSSNTADTDVSPVQGEEDALVGLKEENANQIRQMNKGTALTSLGINNLDLAGYKLLNKTSAIMTYKKGTKIEKTGNVTMTLSVPNLKTGLTVQVLFFNNMTGRWQLITPSGVDATQKQLTVTIPNSGTVAVIYK